MNFGQIAYSFFLTLAVLFIGAAELSATARMSALNGFQVTPANRSPGAGTGSVILNAAETQVTVTLFFLGLAGTQTSAAIHGPALPGATGLPIFNLPVGNFTQTFAVTPQQAADLKAGRWYFEVRSSAFPAGEIRGQITETAGAPVAFPASSGALDTTFGAGGMVSTPLGTGNDVAQAVAIQPDGKIVVAGYGPNGTNNDFAVVRYNPNGTLDDTFDGASNGNGIVLAPIGTSEDEAFGIALQPDGKIILAGQSYNGTNTDIAFARFNANGTLDNTFDGDGRIVIAGPGNDLVRSVAVQPDGRIVAVGNIFTGTNTDIALIRLTANGSLDAGFDGNAGNANGIVTTAIGTSNDLGYGVAIQPDARIVVAGYFVGPFSTDTVILRYTSDGRLDPTFSGDGIFTNSFSPTNTDEALSLALQPDGKIVFAGCIRDVGANDFLFARITSDGGLDTSFGTGGSLIVPFSNLADIGLGVAVQTDGKIIGSGFGSNGANNDFAIARLNANGTLDTTFDGDGRVLTTFGPSSDSANAVAIQADGKIVAVGRAVIGSTADFGVARYGYGSNPPGNDGFLDLNPTTAIRFDNAFGTGTSSATYVNSAALPPLPAGWSFIGSPRNLQTSALFSGEILVKITLPTGITVDSFNAVRIFQYENGAWTDKTAASPPRDFAAKTVYARVSSLSMIAAAAPTGTAAFTAVSGQLSTAQGRAVFPAVVSITSANGVKSYTTVNPFGYFRFTGIGSDRNYLIGVTAKRHDFAPQLISIDGDSPDIHLTAEP